MERREAILQALEDLDVQDFDTIVSMVCVYILKEATDFASSKVEDQESDEYHRYLVEYITQYFMDKAKIGLNRLKEELVREYDKEKRD